MTNSSTYTMISLEPSRPPRKFSHDRTNKMLWKLLFQAALFYFLLPGVLVRLPPGVSTMTVNLTHAVVFAIVSKFLWSSLKGKLGK